MGLRNPAACDRISGSMKTYKKIFTYCALTIVRRKLPITTPGSNEIITGMVLGMAFLKCDRSYTSIAELTRSSTITKAGFRTLFGKNNTASGTARDENPYPRAPFTKEANREIAAKTTIIVIVKPSSNPASLLGVELYVCEGFCSSIDG